MKNFYEMIQILNKNKINEGKKRYLHHDERKTIQIGERVDYYSWDGELKIGYDEEEGSYYPVAWGIEGRLIKFKQDENGETVYDEKRNPVIDREFENPGVHGENIPEPYLSGSKEVTGLKEVIDIILKEELEESGERNTDPNKYDWQKYDGTMQEDPDILFAHHSKVKHGDQEITLGKMDDYSPGKLPWYRNESKIEPQEMEEAKKLARQVTNANKGPEREYEWRLKIYTDARTGQGRTGAYPWFVLTHEQALEELKKHCYHEWEKGEDFSQYNQYLYTGKSGHYETCKRCGQKREAIKWQNNYSGD